MQAQIAPQVQIGPQTASISFQVKVKVRGHLFVKKIRAASWWDAYTHILHELADAQEQPCAISVRPIAA